MNIIARIRPLYDDLIAIGFPALMEDNEFIRIANNTGFTNEYAEAVNEATSKQQTNWLGLIDGIPYQDVLAIFLNRLYNADATKLTELLTPAICKCIDFSYFITSINDLKRDLQLLGATEEQLNKIVVVWDEVSKNYYKKVIVLKSLLTSRATGGEITIEISQNQKSCFGSCRSCTSIFRTDHSVMDNIKSAEYMFNNFFYLRLWIKIHFTKINMINHLPAELRSIVLFRHR